MHGEGTAKKSHLTVSIRKAVTGSHLVSGHVYPNGTVGWSQEWMKWEWSQKLKKEAEKAKAEGGEGSGEAAEIAKDEKKVRIHP